MILTVVSIIFLICIIWYIIVSFSKGNEQTKQREISRKKDLLRSKRITLIKNDLFENPQQFTTDLLAIHSNARASEIRGAVKDVFIQFLNNRSFSKAQELLDYHPIDDIGLLKISMALHEFENSENIKLKPQTYKISMIDDETAYEKLPCNWQKIHTYLAPLEDEIEQADILDSGNIYITDQRVFFVGKKGSETVRLSDIAYMDHKEDALQFFRDEGLSEIFAFPTPHHATYAKLVIEELMGG